MSRPGGNSRTSVSLYSPASPFRIVSLCPGRFQGGGIKHVASTISLATFAWQLWSKLLRGEL